MLSRRIIQTQKAIRRSAPHPDFTGLDAMMASTLDESGGVVTSKFDEWVAGEQKTAAVIMKNSRMFQEEQAADAKKHTAVDPGWVKKEKK